MASVQDSRDARRHSENPREFRRVREKKAKSDGITRRETEPLRRMADEAQRPNAAILLLGLSGVGKSTFISHLTSGRMKIGHSLTSCTRDVDGYEYTRPNGQRIYLIDTPGFDDTEKDNIAVLQRISMLLYTIYDSEALNLAGVLYLHRISDVRMQGSSLKSMRVIEKMCGESNFRAISVATTMWELVDPELAGKREQSLISTPEFFGTLAEGGATVVRHLNNRNSAEYIIEDMLQKERKVILAIQREMAIERKSLANTAAGQFLRGDYEQTRARYERELELLQDDLDDATQENDADLITMISEQRRDYEERIKDAELHQDELFVSPEQMEQQQEAWFAQKAREMDDETPGSTEKTPREIELEEQLEREEREHIREMNKLRLANRGKDVENDLLKKEHRMWKERVKEQLRAERERKDRRHGFANQSFLSLLRQGLNFMQPLQRALTAPRDDKKLQDQRAQGLEPKGHPGSQRRTKPRKKKRDKQISEFDRYDAVHDEDISEDGVEESMAVHAAQHAVVNMVPTRASGSNHQPQVQPGFENLTYVKYAVDTSGYSRRSTSIALTRTYPSSSQQQ